ncbi:MAG: hypothetical protein HY698_21230 [Deltaproteobacteria bacterium]|nr:hypothetical protein [Deltaproteobacteria bacterium]
MAACGGSTDKPDARPPQPDGGVDAAPKVVDAAAFDAAPPVDAAPPDPLSATISVTEMKVLNPQAGGAKGVTVSISFTDSSKSDKKPAYDDYSDATLKGCTVYEYDVTKNEKPLDTLNEGDVTITAKDSDPVIPPCKYTPAGYWCTGRVGTVASITAIPANPDPPTPAMALVTAKDHAFAAADVGRYLVIAGASNAANNGAYPIVAYNDTAKGVVIANSKAVAEVVTGPDGDTGITPTWTLLVGAGPNPATPEAYLLEDDDVVVVSLAPGGNKDWDAFGPEEVKVADSFELSKTGTDDSQAKIQAVPMDGKEFSLTCGNAASGDYPAQPCGQDALGSVILMETNDGDVPQGAPATYWPQAKNKVVTVKCVQALAPQVKVSDKVMEIIKNSGATRIRTTFLRLHSKEPTSNHKIRLVSGHGTIGFTAVPPPQ